MEIIMNLKQKVIKTASKMYGISVARSSELVDTAYKKIHADDSINIDIREEDVLLFIGRIVLPCLN